MTPELTAVIPTHNRASLLATTLRTVLWQRDVSLEVIVVDDGSTDGTAAVIAQLGDPRVRVVRHNTAQGVCVARNLGAAQAAGQWLAFCDDDDLWAPDKLARQLAAARAGGRDWAYGGAVHVSIDLRLMNAKAPPSPELLLSQLPGWSLMPGGSSNVIVRAETFEAAGRWDPTLINLADWDLWARLARQGPPSSLEAPLVGYRIHPGNASADTGLILREARILDGRYGARVDYGALHHYLGWVYLRSGRRRPAVRHFARAATRGRAWEVARDVSGLTRRRVGSRLPALGARPDAFQQDWLARAETWVSQLRETTVKPV